MSKKKKNKKKKAYQWKLLAATALIDLIVGILLLIAERLILR